MKPYPAYKDSGLQWLGPIPEHWQTRRLKFLAPVRLSNVDKHSIEGQSPVLLCNYTDVYYNDRITNALKFMEATASPEQVEKFGLLPGDVLMTKDSETANDIGIPALVTENLENVICGYHLALLRPNSAIRGGFLKYCLGSFPAQDHFSTSANGVTRFGLSRDDIASAPLLLPPPVEQSAIVAFLDRKCADIDRFLDRKRRLIALLKEQKAAIITQAVTQGLNPDAPRKPSGVEWLGDVPEHWKVRRLKYVAPVRLSNVDKHSVEGEQLVLLCNYTDVYYNEKINSSFTFMQATASSEQIAKFQLQLGDVLITKDSETPDDIGVSSVVEESVANVICGYHLALLRPNALTSGIFIKHSLSCSPAHDHFCSSANGVTRVGLSRGDIATAPLIMPPLEEQKAIVGHIETESAKIDAVIGRTEREMELMHEYRTALISEAVTGKIDVRESAGRTAEAGDASERSILASHSAA